MITRIVRGLMASDRRLLILHGMWIVEQHMHVVHVHDAVQQATRMFHFGMQHASHGASNKA